ncbi:MAG: putative porin, partial [Bacteroidales bacterium]
KGNEPKQKTIRQWTLSSDYTDEVTLPFDTVFSLCNRYRISDRYSSMNATLGNYGLPFYQLNFFDRITDPDKYLYSYYYPFMYTTDRIVFMDTQVPFTELAWTFGAPRETSEQTLRVRHSQNINRYLNFGLIYDIIYSLGQYSYQRAEDKTFTFHISYDKPKYKMYMALGINNLTSYENGGITGTDQLSLFTGRDIPVKLGSLDVAEAVLKNRNLLLVQKYKIGRSTTPSDSSGKKKSGFLGLSGTFSHILEWETNKRTYSDNDTASGFYTNIFIKKSTTFDSLYARTLKNTLRFDFTTDETRKFRLGGGVGIRNELFRFGQIVPTHAASLSDTAHWNRSSNVLIGKLYNDIGGKFMWMANGELFLTGYRIGDFTLNGRISKAFYWKKGVATWNITGDIMNRQPSFWYDRWGSNNFEWNNNLNKEFRMDLGTDFSFPARKTELKFNYAIINNYTYFDKSALPSQHSGGLSVAAITARKEFRAWKFHLATDVLVQKSSDIDVLDLPLLSVRSALFFEHLFRFRQTNGRLNTQIGADVLYYTPYYSYAWMPATGRYYNQDATKTGDYPFINVFLNVKLKRTRIFVMLDHVNSGFMGYNYFMVPSYPQNVRMLRYGIAWTFYN